MKPNLNNYQEYIMLYLDGELSKAEATEFENFAAKHPQVAEELELFTSLKLPAPETITYAHKNKLYKKENKKSWLPFAAAASVAAITIGLFLVYKLSAPNQAMPQPSMALTPNPTNAIQAISAPATVKPPPYALANIKAQAIAHKTATTNPKLQVVHIQVPNLKQYRKDANIFLTHYQCAPKATNTSTPQKNIAQQNKDTSTNLAIVPTPIQDTATKLQATASTAPSTYKTIAKFNSQKHKRIFNIVNKITNTISFAKRKRAQLQSETYTVMVLNKTIISIH
jgi:hypothetical protein